MQKKDIKNLAKKLATGESLKNPVTDFILKFNRRDLKVFLSNYKLALKKNTVYVTSASEISNLNFKELEGVYKNKRIIKKSDLSLGAGIKIEDNDNIIDFTFKKYINDTILQLK